LVEASGKNEALRSAGFEVSGTWVPSNISVSTGTTAAFTAPDGSTDADKLVESAVSGLHICQQTITLTSGATYTVSCFVKAAERTLGRLRVLGSGAATDLEFNLTLGTVSGGTNPFIQNYGNEWYRIGTTFAATQASNNFVIFIKDASGAINYLGDGTSGFYVWGAQLETGSVATTYIPTTTGSASRNADQIVASGALVSGLIGQTEGTMYAEFSVDFNNRNADILSVDGGSASDGFFISLRSSSVVQLLVRTASANALIFQRTGAYPTGVNKLAVAYKNGDFAICLNGTTVQTSTSSITMPSVSIIRANLGNAILYTLDQQLRIRAAALYTTRLTNEQLAFITQP